MDRILTRKLTVATICFLAICFGSFKTLAQERDFENGVTYYTEGRIGCAVYFYQSVDGSHQKFPGAKFFASLLVNAGHEEWISTSYGSTVSLYTKSLGNNMNPLYNDLQVDFVNGFCVNLGSREQDYRKYLYTMHNTPAYNLTTYNKYGINLGTNFILNNHRRNQSVAFTTVTAGPVSVLYYNDGVFWVLGDNFDRWWTGGLTVFVHDPVGFNRLEASFDQFTGYSRMTYELANFLGLEVNDYTLNGDGASDAPDDKTVAFTSSSYNSASYDLKVYLNQDFAVNAGFIGSLKYKKNEDAGVRYWSLQDIIHIVGKHPLHPNEDVNRIFGGVTFNKNMYSDEW